MFFRQVLYRDLGCASYILGDAGKAAVIDPRWDVSPYLELAAAEHLDIAYVLETHDHADHVSGRQRLVELTGARGYRAGQPDDNDPDTIHGGEEIALGAVRVRAIDTPGHRPQHLSFAVVDLTRGPDPWLLLTGDSLLVGDLARPDLVLDAERGAALMHSSLGQLLGLPDYVEVWPAHVGGSLCGGAGLSGKTSSTLGFERRHNVLLGSQQDAFVHGLVAEIPPRPPNVERIVELNIAGAGEPPPVRELGARELGPLIRQHVWVLDGRDPRDFDSGHLLGALNLPLSSPGVGTRAAWSIAPGETIVIAAADRAAAEAMASALQAVGLFDMAGFIVGDSTTWAGVGLPVATAEAWDVADLARGLRAHAVDLIDVRDTAEWAAGHVSGSHHLPLHQLGSGRLPDLPVNGGTTTAVACAGGMRAAFAASVLRRAGRDHVVRVAAGGVADLSAQGIELTLGP